MNISMYIHIYVYTHIAKSFWPMPPTWKMGSKGIVAPSFGGSRSHRGPSGLQVGRLRSSWDHLGSNLRGFGATLPPSWCKVGAPCFLAPSWAILGPRLCQARAKLAQVRPKLCPSWAKLGPSWAKRGQVGPQSTKKSQPREHPRQVEQQFEKTL